MTAMGYSGAAVNPNAGPGGRGITRNRFVSFVMAVLNLRLGGWIPNPKYSEGFRKYVYCQRKFLVPAWYGILSWLGWGGGYNENSTYIQLSDGGHFENLGLYELLRRELDVIIVSDAGADPKFTFSDLRNAMKLAERDFNIEFELDGENELRDLMPDKGHGIGSPVALATKGFLKVNITYHDGTKGLLYYIKSTFIGGKRVRTQSYKIEYPLFPDQSTSDQFFDEAQFHAYRDLGYTIAAEMSDKLNVFESIYGVFGRKRLKNQQG